MYNLYAIRGVYQFQFQWRGNLLFSLLIQLVQRYQWEHPHLSMLTWSSHRVAVCMWVNNWQWRGIDWHNLETLRNVSWIAVETELGGEQASPVRKYFSIWQLADIFWLAVDTLSHLEHGTCSSHIWARHHQSSTYTLDEKNVTKPGYWDWTCALKGGSRETWQWPPANVLSTACIPDTLSGKTLSTFWIDGLKGTV